IAFPFLLSQVLHFAIEPARVCGFFIAKIMKKRGEAVPGPHEKREDLVCESRDRNGRFVTGGKKMVGQDHENTSYLT
ncbi:MAG: hypothetical protein ACE5EI_10295, partial [Thermodesulfobacteriota bacterium]